MRAASSRNNAPLSPNGIVRDPVVSAAHATLRTPAARVAIAAAWIARAVTAFDGVFTDMSTSPSVQQTELNHQPDSGHDGDCQKPLREPCDKI